jgi:hypothetical protein
MNLFIVRNTKTGKTLDSCGGILGFERKTQAKHARKEANGTDDEGDEQFSSGWTVANGPDHRHYV